MTLFPRLLVLMLVVAACILAGVEPSFASHFRYGTLSWEPWDQSTTPGQVKFRLIVAFRRDAYTESDNSAPETGDIITDALGGTRLTFGDTVITPTLRFRVIAHSETENWIIGEALHPGTDNPGILHTYQGNVSSVVAFVNGCCRLDGTNNMTLNNRSNAFYRLETKVKPHTGNSSPVSSQVPIVVVPEGTVQFVVPAGDANGDQLKWRRSVNPEEGGGTHPDNLDVNQNTGVVTWNNTGLDKTNFWTTQIVIEEPEGSDTKSKIPVDFLLKIQDQIGNRPTCSVSGDSTQTVSAGSAVPSFTVTGTDLDAGATVTLHSAGLPAGATMTPALPNSGASPRTSTFNWTPTAAQRGTHVLQFSATDEHGQQALCPAKTIQVNNRVPTAVADSKTTSEDTTLTFPATDLTANDTDTDGDTLTVTAVTATTSTHGTVTLSGGSITYDPEDNFNGTASFTYTISDGHGGTASGTVTVTVTAVNDTPFADNKSATTAEDIAVSIELSGTDVEGGLSFSIASGPGHGTLGSIGPITCFAGSSNGQQGPTSCTASVIYTPAANYTGGDSFTYTVSDGSAEAGTSAPATVSITVTPVNDAPVLTVPGPQSVAEGASMQFTVSATDADSESFTMSVSGLPPGANFDGTTFTWTPQANEAGTYFVQFSVSDGIASDSKEVRITVQDTLVDSDGDGVPDSQDNCLTVNTGQSDRDGDGQGDLCDDTPLGPAFENRVEADANISPPASAAGYQEGESIFVTASITYRRVNHAGDTATDPYFVVRPNRYNVFLALRDAAGHLIIPDRVLEGPGVHLREPTDPGSDLAVIPGGTDPCPSGATTTSTGDCQLSTTINLTEWYTQLPPGTYTVTPIHTNYVYDFDLPPTGPCPTGKTCFEPIWLGKADAPSTTFTIGDQCPNSGGEFGVAGTGCPVADKNTVRLKIAESGGGPATTAPLAGARVRVFDKNAQGFKAVVGNTKTLTADLLRLIWERDQARVGTCVTDSTGVCFAGEEQMGEYLVIVRFYDEATGQAVYTGKSKSPRDFVGGLASLEFEITKVFKNGVFQGYR